MYKISHLVLLKIVLTLKGHRATPSGKTVIETPDIFLKILKIRIKELSSKVYKKKKKNLNHLITQKLPEFYSKTKLGELPEHMFLIEGLKKKKKKIHSFMFMFQSHNWCSPHFIMSTFSHNKPSHSSISQVY